VKEDALFAQLAALRDETGRRKFLLRHKSLLRADVVARLSESVPKRIWVDAQEALALAEAACAIARRLESKTALAQSLRAKGNALYALRRLKEAVSLHREAAAIFEELGAADEVGRTLSTSIQPLILLGEYDAALLAAEKARAIFAGQGDALRLARLELNVGNIYHRQDRFDEALGCSERAYRHSRQAGTAEASAWRSATCRCA